MNDTDRVIAELSIPVPGPGCWIWLGSCDERGYGYLRFNGRNQRAHRASYETVNGPIPSGLSICHKCDTPSCVNPDHLFAGTQRDNLRDASAKKRIFNQTKTTCPKGHPYEGANLFIARTGARGCRACMKAAARDGMRRLRAKAAAPTQGEGG